jgi:hypothetical protein
MICARFLLAIGVGLCLVGHEAAARDLANLPLSKVCAVHNSGYAQRGGVSPTPNVITMGNDGGWCGNLNISVYVRLAWGAPMHLTRGPDHGQVSIVVESGGTRVLYKPDPGFIGSDSFSVVNETLNIVMPYDVVVTQ